MEGPSLIIAREELAPYLRKKIISVAGSLGTQFPDLTGQRLLELNSWGKHLILCFNTRALRIHFLMFGSYRINQPRDGRVPKLQLNYPGHNIYFYSCAIGPIPLDFNSVYDWSVDLMSPQWDAKKVLLALRARPLAEICDVLMDQDIFAGLGNIMKNEILFRLKLHPRCKVFALGANLQRRLVKETRLYATLFYQWKKVGVLKRNWQIMRKKTCPVCDRKVTKAPTGKLQRLSHYCAHCQKKTSKAIQNP